MAPPDDRANNRSDTPGPDWIDTCCKIAEFIGLNPTRVRWKLMRYQDRFSQSISNTSAKVRNVGYEHRICASCGSLQAREDQVCSVCGKPLHHRSFEVLHRLGSLAPELFSPTNLIITAILVCYGRTALFQQGSLLEVSGLVLLQFGANYPALVWGGEWWRLATSVFLHAGIWHLLFNLVALKQVGPEVEEIFGRGRMLFFFMLTGIVASLGSAWWRVGGVGIGASGALMGLVGLTAGWGHRDGGSVGLMARNMMAQWGVYTIVFGFLIGADNVAHIVGFFAGGLVGLLVKPKLGRRERRVGDQFLGLVGFLVFLVTVTYVLFLANW